MHRGRELPGFINTSITTMLWHDVVNTWKQPTRKYVLDVKGIVSRVFEGITDGLEPISSYRGFSTVCKREIRSMIEQRTQDAITAVETKLSAEDSAFTLNHYFMDTYNAIVHGASDCKTVT